MPNNKENALLESALNYAEHGWKVLPLQTPHEGECSCGTDCGNHIGKHPRWNPNLLPSGWKSATTNSDLIREWWHTWPDANIGIVTGVTSGLIVLDIDPRNKGDDTIAELLLKYGDLPDSLRVRSGGGGWHIYFRHPGGHIKSTTLAQGVDLKADGGYIVAPPSLHASGELYRWENDNGK